MNPLEEEYQAVEWPEENVNVNLNVQSLTLTEATSIVVLTVRNGGLV